VEDRPQLTHRALPRLLLGGLGGGLVAGLVNLILLFTLGPLRVGSPAHYTTVGPAMIVPESIVPGFLGAFLLQSSEPLDSRGRGFFVILSLGVLLVSFSLPMSTGADTRTVLVLCAMHVITALGVLGGLWIAMPRRVARPAHRA
jgi:hypothetical protein